jgi:Uma2 family endonuclease
MSVIAPVQSPCLEPAPWPIFRLSVEQYHDMINFGILTEDDPVELLEGILVEKMPKKPGHSGATRKARETLKRVVPPGWFVDSQEPITTEDSEPEPDLAVIRGKPEDFLAQHPKPQDVGMTGEIADSTLARDRGSKKKLYARANIPVYWIINLVERQVEVYTEPTGPPGGKPDYRCRQDYAEKDEVPLVLDGIEVARVPVKDLLP